MKKLIQRISFASLMLFTTTIGKVYAVDASGTSETPININLVCSLIKEMGPTFKILRTLAFVGAAFIIAGWAWGYISSGKVEVKDVKEKGIGMLVGFALLFGIAIIMTMIDTGCTDAFKTWK